MPFGGIIAPTIHSRGMMNPSMNNTKCLFWNVLRPRKTSRKT
jgi:hypothetical protein